MISNKLSIAIVGADMGGLTVAATLSQIRVDIQVYEQASRFSRIGAGIQMLPNSMQVLRRIGVKDRLRSFAFAPVSHLNRVSDTGEVLIESPMPENRYVASHRKPWTSVIQAISSANTWMSDAAGGDPDWLYGYDAWNVPLSKPVATE